MQWSEPHLDLPREGKWKPEYLIPRFIADCARRWGFKGIVWQSTRGSGECIVLFDTQKPVFIGQPFTVSWDPVAEHDWPF